jgi:hypothetical protein
MRWRARLARVRTKVIHLRLYFLRLPGDSGALPVTHVGHVGHFMGTLITFRIPDSLARALAERKQKASINVSAFCRRAIERELQRPVIDVGPERQVTRQPVLFSPKQETR